ncbi:MAG: cation-transporting P-type ATPase [Planctomycetes bacterium]|nr:cation-transporting P-type ATPase [Planctomycetota bacterium]
MDQPLLPDSVRPWGITPEELAAVLQTNAVSGLTRDAANQRLRQYGPNVIKHQASRRWVMVFLSQFTNMMVALLVSAAVISGLIGEWTDALLICLIVVANAIVGFSQEWTAERAIESLRQMSEPFAQVCRDGQWLSLPAEQLVAGDLIEIVTGDLIPADARIVAATELETSEAALTGESHPVEKTTDRVDSASFLPDRRCMVFAGTSVITGHARALVTRTGSWTELGRIAEMLTTASPAPTPLQQRLDRMSRQLSAVIVLTAVVMFVIGFERHGLGRMLLTSVGLAVAALPEGLPAVITIGLALGAKRMAARNAVIRRLTAVETLGSVNVICTDKTGTLTQNRMTVSQVNAFGEAPAVYQQLLQAAVLCSDAQRGADGGLLGSPTERALLTVALENGINIEDLRQEFSRVAEIPFTSARKRMATLHQAANGDHLLIVKGAIERVLPCCSKAAGMDGAVPSQDLLDAAGTLAGSGQRVLAFARRVWQGSQTAPLPEEWESNLEFLGMITLADPVRPEVPDAIVRCQSAGITPVLITGDHPATALSIAEQLGIWHSGENILTGVELDQMSDEQLQSQVARTTVYARVSPEHKLRIVRCHQNLGSVTAMTGDGVNDAPALKQADIGVSMGLNGTDVAKDASAMVLADDNFASIVAAVEEGRAVYDNIRKSIAYLFAGNTAEVLILFVALVAGFPLPLFPIQILWINLVTDGIPALAMAFEPPEAAVMKRTPRARSEGLFGRGLAWGVLLIGTSVAVALLVLFQHLLPTDLADSHRVNYAQTAVFMTLALAELLYAISARDLSRGVDVVGFLRNRALVGSIVIGAALQFSVCYLPPLQSIFHTVSLSPFDLAVCLGVATTGFVALEVWKLAHRQFSKANDV